MPEGDRGRPDDAPDFDPGPSQGGETTDPPAPSSGSDHSSGPARLASLLAGVTLLLLFLAAMTAAWLLLPPTPGRPSITSSIGGCCS